MKKKLTKDHLNERKRKLNKAFHILAYVSLAFNVLFISLMAFSGCAAKGSTNNNDPLAAQAQKQLRTDKQYRFGDAYSNDSVVSWDFTKLNESFSFSGGYQNPSFNYTLNQNAVICNYTSPIASANYLRVNGSLHYPVDNGDFIEVSAHNNNEGVISGYILYIKWQYSFEYAWTRITTPQGGSYYDSAEGFSLVYNSAWTSTYNFSLDWLNYFHNLEYVDYNLTYNWNPWVYYTSTQQGFIGGMKPIDSYNLIDYGCFSVYGQLYTHLKVYYKDNSRPTGNNTYNYHTVKIFQRDGSSIKISGEPVYWIDNVVAYNVATDTSTTIWHCYFGAEVDDTSAVVLRPFTSNNFIDKNFAFVRLFDVNSDQAISIPYTPLYDNAYTNGSVLGASFDYGFVGGDTSFGDVFALVGSAFNGLTNLLSIKLFPGITLGILFFLPVVGIIIFAVLRVLKK